MKFRISYFPNAVQNVCDRCVEDLIVLQLNFDYLMLLMHNSNHWHRILENANSVIQVVLQYYTFWIRDCGGAGRPLTPTNNF